MTFEKILNDLSSGVLTPENAKALISERDKSRKINYYAHIWEIKKDPLSDPELQELESIVNILQILYNSDAGSPISDSMFDDLQEILINMGIPRLTGSIEINDSEKMSHIYTNLRGTLDKVYYLTKDEPRTNKAREYLDEWIRRTEIRYEKRSGKKIDLNDVRIMCQPKFDGVSGIIEVDENGKVSWLTRGDTGHNLASNISNVMNLFDSRFNETPNQGIKTEIMVSEEAKDRINELMPTDCKYRNSRQIAISTTNQNDPDFKVESLNPIPLRLMMNGFEIEQIHPTLISEYPTLICRFANREMIREFANKNRYVLHKGEHYRTDGVVMTILDPAICQVLGRENDINKFEIAYKFTEESAISKVKDVEFYVSDFGYVTPVLVVNDVIMKGNTINHISLSNKERFDELNLSYGDEVKVLYDIIPYAKIDASCKRAPFGRKIEFTPTCPKCHQPLNLNTNQVQCKNPDCPSRLIGRMMNYCNALRIKNIGFNTLDTLYSVGLLDQGILSLYKLKKKQIEMYNLEGFGKLKTRKILAEIEAKRRLKDYEFFGALGIEGLQMRTFQLIFYNIKLTDFLDMILLKNYGLLKARLVSIPGIGDSKALILIEYMKNPDNFSYIRKLMKEITLQATYDSKNSMNGTVMFSGCRPNEDLESRLHNIGFEPVDSWKSDAIALIIPYEGFQSTKVSKATLKGVPIITFSKLKEDVTILNKLRR